MQHFRIVRECEDSVFRECLHLIPFSKNRCHFSMKSQAFISSWSWRVRRECLKRGCGWKCHDNLKNISLKAFWMIQFWERCHVNLKKKSSICFELNSDLALVQLAVVAFCCFYVASVHDRMCTLFWTLETILLNFWCTWVNISCFTAELNQHWIDIIQCVMFFFVQVTFLVLLYWNSFRRAVLLLFWEVIAICQRMYLEIGKLGRTELKLPEKFIGGVGNVWAG